MAKRTEDPKVRENRLRRVAARRGLLLNKSRRRDPAAVDYGGFMLTDAITKAVVLGGEPVAYFADLDDVEAFLSPEPGQVMEADAIKAIGVIKSFLSGGNGTTYAQARAAQQVINRHVAQRASRA